MNKFLVILYALGVLSCFVQVQPLHHQTGCVIVMGGGYACSEINVSFADAKTLEFCGLLRNDGSFDVVYLDNFTYPTSKPLLDTLFLNLSTSHDNLYLFGLSAGALVALVYAQQSTLFTSAVVCSAPVDYWRKTEWYYHLVDTAEETKIPVLFVFPSQDKDYCEQMQEYYDKDVVSPKTVVMWDVNHNPLDNDPAALSALSTTWYESTTNMKGGD